MPKYATARNDLGALVRFRPPQPLREPQTGANVFNRHQTQRDPVRFLLQVRSFEFDSARR
jgi:hypothetical protein